MIIVHPYYPFTAGISAMFLSKVLKTKKDQCVLSISQLTKWTSLADSYNPSRVSDISLSVVLRGRIIMFIR